MSNENATSNGAVKKYMHTISLLYYFRTTIIVLPWTSCGKDAVDDGYLKEGEVHQIHSSIEFNR